MFKVKLLNTIAEKGLASFPRDLYTVGDNIENPDAILVRSTDMLNMTLPASVKIVGRAGAGVNNIPVSALTQSGVVVLNTPGANANAVRELVIGSMLLASRHIFEAWDYVNHLEAEGSQLEKQVEQQKKRFVGCELMGKTLGLIGLGSVGVKVANAAVALGMKVIGFDPSITINRAWELSAEVKQANQLDQLLQESDFISLHVPLTDDTRHMVSKDQLDVMKPSVVLLNFSREGIVDNEALRQAFEQKKVALYINDFPNAFFRGFPQVMSLPHLGASTVEAEENCAVMVVKQVREFLENGNIINSVNFPYVELAPAKTEQRLAIVNQNVPNMVAQISSKLAAAGLNIVSLLNKSRDDMAYTMIDINAPASEKVLAEIQAIEGVVRVRQL